MRRIYLDTSAVAALVHEVGTAAAVETAARLLAQVLPLRSGDALHLALCQRLTLQLASFTRGLCKPAADHQVVHEQLLI